MRHRAITMLAIGIAAAVMTLPVRAQNAPASSQDAHLRAIPGGQVSAYQPPDAAKSGASCVRDTGSAVQRKNGECVPVNGKSYSKDQLDRTGEKNLGPALQKLDPSISSTGH